jgi:hypothetical protein
MSFAISHHSQNSKLKSHNTSGNINLRPLDRLIHCHIKQDTFELQESRSCIILNPGFSPKIKSLVKRGSISCYKIYRLRRCCPYGNHRFLSHGVKSSDAFELEHYCQSYFKTSRSIIRFTQLWWPIHTFFRRCLLEMRYLYLS